MTVKQQIKKKLAEFYGPGKVAAGFVFKGNGFETGNGWWFVPFNQRPVFLGKDKKEAFLTIVGFMEDEVEEISERK